MGKLDLQIANENFDLLLIQETSFDPMLPKNIWTINGYTLMTFQDKTCSLGPNSGKNGGTAIYVKNELVRFCSVLPISSPVPMAQMCGVKFDKIQILNVYRSPNQDPEEAIQFAEFLQENLPKQGIFLAGDFNLGDTDFVKNQAKKRDHRAFVKMFENLNLIQHITDATNPSSGNILDLFLTYDNSKLKDVFVDYSWSHVVDGELKSVFEHYPVCVEFSSRPDYDAFELKKDTFNVDVDKFRQLFQDRRVGQNYEHQIMHYRIVENGLLRQCVCGKENCEDDLKCHCGMSHDIKEEIEMRHKDLAMAVRECYDQACPMKKHFFYTESKNRFSKKTLQQKKRIKNLRRNGNISGIVQEQLYLEELVNEDLETETKNMIKFWSKHRNNVYQTIKRTKKMSSKSDGVYKDFDAGDFRVVYEDDEKVAILVEHSRKVLKDTDAFAFSWEDTISDNDAAPFPSRLWQPAISDDIIEYYIDSKIKDKHSIGACGTSSHMIKLLSDLISRPLSLLYRLMYVSKYSPLEQRTSKIVFIPKKADNLSNPNNLRGLNVVSPLYLPYEYCICANQYRQLEEAKLLDDSQFGMRLTRNTEMNLVHFHDFLTKNEVNCCGQVIMYTDYQKAFDVVNHKILMEEMNNHRFHPEVGRHFQEWYGNSYQFVQVNQSKSHTIPVRSSVKQGSIAAGMLTFNLIINDLFEEMRQKARELGLGEQFYIASYCDDTKFVIALRPNKSFDGQLDLIQMLIDHFYAWTIKKDLALNKKKCVVLLRNMKKSNREKVQLMLDHEPLKIVDTEIDLGVVTTTVPNALKHIKKQTGVATKVINSIKHIIPRITYSTQLMLWNALVRSVCIYGSHSQFPFNKNERACLRRVFRKFWRLCAIPKDCVKRPITILEFMVLKDLMWMKKATHNEFPHSFDHDDTEIDLTKIHSVRRQSARNHGKTCPENGLEAMSFSIQRLKKRRRQSLRYRHVELYQSLPIEIIQTEDLAEFKQYVTENVITKFDNQENEMVNDFLSGKLRMNYLKQLKIQFDLRKTKEREIEETDSECSDID